MKKRFVLILGARSDIAKAIAYKFAKDGCNIQLAARNAESLATCKTDMELRYQVEVTLHEFDVVNLASHENFVRSLPFLPDIAVCAVGNMGSQAVSEYDMKAATNVIRTNFEGPANILGVLANYFEKRGSGSLIGISSVAGERGRATNYIYGSAKAGFTAFLSGLRNRLSKRGVAVITVIPGYVATKMTEKMDLPAKLTTQPELVARAIASALIKKQSVIYVSPIWRFIMIIIRIIPEKIFIKMNI